MNQFNRIFILRRDERRNRMRVDRLRVGTQDSDRKRGSIPAPQKKHGQTNRFQIIQHNSNSLCLYHRYIYQNSSR